MVFKSGSQLILFSPVEIVASSSCDVKVSTFDPDQNKLKEDTKVELVVLVLLIDPALIGL